MRRLCARNKFNLSCLQIRSRLVRRCRTERLSAQCHRMCRLARHIALASLLTITGSFETTKHLERLDAWLTNASAPPTHWRVRSPDDLDNRTDQALSGGARKDVWLSQLRDGRRVVVKALRHEGAFEFGDRASDVAYFELLFLEGLRGEPGIPELFGAYETPPFDVAHKPLVSSVFSASLIDIDPGGVALGAGFVQWTFAAPSVATAVTP